MQRCNFIDDCGDGTDEENCGTSCDFENGMCGWYNPIGYTSQLTIKTGRSTYFGTLEKDHTTNSENGSYLAVTGVNRQKDVAQIHSQFYVISGSHCKFSMWYYKDQTFGSVFSVVILHDSDTNKYQQLWNVTEDSGAEWVNVELDIGVEKHFAMIVQVQIGSATLYASMAIDDIEFKTCSSEHPPVECTSDEWMCTDKSKCIKVWEYCDGKYDCGDKSDEYKCPVNYGDCDFNSEKWKEDCQWEMMKMDFEWTRAKTGRSDETGPKRNQNPRQEGYFLYIDSSEPEPGDRAGVQTPVFKPSEGKCHLRFWYYMKGSEGLGTIEVRTELENGNNYQVFLKRGPQADKWLYGHALVGGEQPFRVSFVATRGEDDKTDIAIDEVKFTHGCEEGGIAIVPTGPTALCINDEFRCKDGSQCIPRTSRCDCRYDCADGSDEMNCPNTCASTLPFIDYSTNPITTEGPHTTVLPRKHCAKGFKLCDDEEKCIPGLLLCDGVKDCTDGSDEKHGCTNAKLCLETFYYCGDRAYPPCISREFLCDGNDDCSDGSDESVCDTCPEDFCRHGGHCGNEGRKIVCNCTENYAQNRCENLKETGELEKKAGYRASGVGWIIGVVIGTLLLVAILFVIWYKRNTNAERSRLPHAVDNPVYGLNLDTLTFGELNSHMPVRSEDGAGATAIENPLYAFKSDIK